MQTSVKFAEDSAKTPVISPICNIMSFIIRDYIGEVVNKVDSDNFNNYHRFLVDVSRNHS